MSGAWETSSGLEPAEHVPASRLRYLVVAVTAGASVLLYLDRFCVSFAVDYIREDLRLSQTEVSWFLSAFFWSYALAQVPSGWLSDRYGARGMLALYVLTWSVFTALMGAAYSLWMLLAMRVAFGLGQAGAYPTAASVVSKWVPFAQRGTASSLIAVGGRVGGAIAPLLTASLMVLFVPMSVSPEFTADSILDAGGLTSKLAACLPSETGKASADASREPRAVEASGTPACRFVSEQLAPLHGDALRAAAAEPDSVDPETLAAMLNGLLDQPGLYDEAAFGKLALNREAMTLLKRRSSGDSLSRAEQRRLNRFLLEAAFPAELGKLYVRGWRPVMFVYGFAGLLVGAGVWFLLRDSPESHPGCNAAERALIASGRPAGSPSPQGRVNRIPLEELLRSRSLWFDSLMQLGTNLGWLFLVTWLPRYLLSQHQVPILQRGVMAMCPITVGFLGMVFGGVLTDALTARWGRKWGRRLPMMLTRFMAAGGYGLCLWFSSLPEDSPLNSPWAFVAAFSLVALSTDMGTAAAWAFKQDIGGRHVGSILGWGNMWGNLGAAMAPLVYDAFLGETPGTAEWNAMFLVCLLAFAAAGVCGLGIDATVPVVKEDE